MKARKARSTTEGEAGKVNENTSFQTLRPPHLLEGLAAFLLMFPIVGLSMTLAAMEYSWLPFRQAFAAMMVSSLAIVIPQVLVVTGRPKAVYANQILAVLYTLLPISLLFVGSFHWLALVPITLTVVLIALTSSQRYWMFVCFYKTVWDQHRLRR